MMRFRSLGSGSGGNATVIESRSGGRTSRVVVDCGFSLKEFESRLARAGATPTDIDAVFITHEHGDHIGCAVSLARRHAIPLWMSRGTWRAIGEPDLGPLLCFARDGAAISVGALELHPYTVAHDAAEPLQLRVSDGAATLGILTDAGSITAHLLANLQGCNALLLECNHDRNLLAASRYPPSLKVRIGGDYGHLANDTAAQILEAVMHAGLKHVVAAHLSEQNNRIELVREALLPMCGDEEVVVANPVRGTPWLGI